MTDLNLIVTVLVLTVVAAPVVLVVVLGVASLLDRPLSERSGVLACQVATVLGLIASAALLIYMLATGQRHVAAEAGDWVAIPHFHYSVKFVFDRLSVPF